MSNTYFTTLAVDYYRPIFSEYPETNFFILQSLMHFAINEKIHIYGFVIMPDHIHLLWQGGDRIQRLKSFTAKKILNYLCELDPEILHQFAGKNNDRKYKFWKSSHGNLMVAGNQTFQQKLQYIHQNPTKSPYDLVAHPVEYNFSSAKSYWNGKKNFPFLTLAPYKSWEVGTSRTLVR